MTTPTNRDRSNSDENEKRSSHTDDSLQTATDPSSVPPQQEKMTRLNTDNLLPLPTDAHGPGPISPQDSREQASRLNDDLELLRAERFVSNQEHELSQQRSRQGRTREPEPEDVFATNPTAVEAVKPPPEKKAGAFAFALWKWLRKFPRVFRYSVYMIPGAALLLIPVLLGHFAVVPESSAVGGANGVYLTWFGIWLEVVWCSLWGSRMITSFMPLIFGGIAIVMGSSNHKKWKDIGQGLELHTALFMWMLAVLCSYSPILNGHRVLPDNFNEDEDDLPHVQWIDVVQKIIIAFFVLAALNWVEKICIQWIATSFHQRTYVQRIETNKSDIDHLVHLYEHSKMRINREDSIWLTTENGNRSGARTPMGVMGKNVRSVFNKAGGVAARVGNDFIGRKVAFNHARKITYEMLRNTASAHSLARLIFRSLAKEGQETIFLEDMQVAFKTAEEAEHAFSIFDKDLNGDISMQEMEGTCNEIHLERKAIAASLKDLDSVIKKLDKVFLFIIVIIAIIVFISIISGSAAAGLASAGSSFLGLAWMLQATAQEFLQSIIFVFVKHPFDVGDRVTVYGNTGTLGTGDDYYVTEISLLYTEFKKMEGHIVQAPNSVLNTLFILNQRRSAGLADPIELKLGFGTDPELIDELKSRMLNFCLENKRDYQPRIISEVKTLNEVQSFTMNLIFFHKSNFQNELLRLQRHNKFAAQLMAEVRSVGLQGPWQVQPGGSRDTPFYWAGGAPPSYDSSKPGPSGNEPSTPATVGDAQSHHSLAHSTSVGPAVVTRSRADSRTGVVPFIDDNWSDFQDVFEARREVHQPHVSRLQSIRERSDLERPQSSTSGAAASRQSHESGSQRRRFFGRPRSSSRTKTSDIV
ncbi:mechanosensitive ion channel [Colletotrichum higginsianum IMI 349063]|uniref:Mechanosensitive ion channel protein n=2 Tax=Colletotrichum higginsianum TaxID=80884 RepID=A0A1B7YHV1_COLHI|nr:mechanosensitive ion channel [Colletotrichum higginsianum IMI 349063]OBR11575.1 mechanosensitive ion channel [Colletotrichum higginsianum IMI 349063]TIC99323.1 putative MscS family protein [Colletotrichum higginsianum]